MATPPPIDLSKDGYFVQRWIGHWYHCYGDVYMARNNDATSHCIRTIKYDLLKDTDEVVQEAAILRQLRHPHIIECSRCFVSSDSIVITTTSFPYGSCQDILETNFTEGLPEEALSAVAYQILKALQYLHTQEIIHRGIRGSHLLVDEKGKVTLSGFRNAVKLPDNRKTCVEFDRNMATMLPWLAPEVVQQDLNGYTTASDIYSLGITLVELANGVVPFQDMEPLRLLYEKGLGTLPRLLDRTTIEDSHLSIPAHRAREFTTHFHDFVSQCCRSIQFKRPSAKQLFAHRFTRSKRKNILEYLPNAMTVFDVQRESLRDKLPDTTAIQCPKWVYDDDDYK